MKHLNFLITSTFLLILATCMGQTNPESFDLSSGDFSFNGFSDAESTMYPANTQGWRFASEPGAAFLGEPSADRDLANNASNPTSGSIKNEAENGISFLNSGSNGIGALVVAINTTGRENIELGWIAEDIRDGSTRENGLKLQYSLGETGDFTDVENTTYISDPTDFNDAATFSGVALPADANDQEVVQVRWLYFYSSGGGARDRIRLDEVLITSEEMPGPTVSVTFQVDMSNEMVDPSGVGISGSFNAFEFMAMTDEGNGLYSIALDLEVGTEIEYKFRNGDAFEDVPETCGTGPFNNRGFTVPDADTTIDAVCYSLCGPCPIPGASYELTIRVNASQVFNINPSGIHIAGSFNDFTPEPMTNLGILNYTFTVMVEEGTQVEWKFLNGNSFDGQEMVPETCGSPDGFDGFNRFFVMPEEDTVLENVCFSSCDPCGILEEHEVTIQVDASLLADVDPAGIHLGGSFTEFIPEPMEDLGDGIWSYTFIAAEGQPLTWRFLNGTSYDNAEIVPEPCGVDDGFGNLNRFFTVPELDLVLELVCFASCGLCEFPGEVYNLEFQVDAAQIDVDAEGLHIAGTFNDFNPEPMLDAGDGTYTFTAEVEEGTVVLWKYLNGNSFDGAESVPAACGQDDGFGGFNRDLLMPSENTTLDVVCFAACEACSDIGESFELVFQVDASQIDVDAEGLHIAGSFNDFSPTPMVDAGAGIYTFTATVEEATTVLWKYLNGNSFDGAESVPAACGQDDGFGGFNRDLLMPSENTTLDAVCFAACEACTDPGESFDLVFQVDASQIDVNVEGLHIAGSFNGFNPEPMQDAGNGLYTFSASIISGSEVLWKYTNGPTFDGVENVPAACGTDDGFGGFNRNFTMPEAATVLDAVCFSACEACGDPGETFSLTFQLDASQVASIDPSGMHIAGSFNDFSPEAMTDAGGGIYTFTVEITAGTAVLWKYLNGDNFDGAESVPEECGLDDGFGAFNRNIIMPAQNAVLSAVCFSSCLECVVGVNNVTALDELSIYPNPSNGVFSILAPHSGNAQISVYELSGRLVYREQRQLNAEQAIEVNTTLSVKGFYLVEVEVGSTRYTARIAVM